MNTYAGVFVLFQVFRCIPSNEVSTFDELTAYRSCMPLCMSDRSKAEKLLEAVQGHLVEFPMRFLCRAQLAPSIKSKEGLVPFQIFT